MSRTTTASVVPTLRVERSRLRIGAGVVAGMDEVGRGALAGPVTVGVALVTAETRSAPVGLRDSKLLSPNQRRALVPRLRRWVAGHAVGHASAAEIDEYGIMAALRLAGRRALGQLPIRPDVILLDGNHDWLTDPRTEGLFAFLEDAAPAPPVVTMIKADLRCSSVAAASVLAKVERDGMMVAFGGQHPAYGWTENKGYAAPEHLDALSRLGPCELHRRSWQLPGCAGSGYDARVAGVPGEPGMGDNGIPAATALQMTEM